MKYFKVTNVDDPEEEFYVSSTLPNETPGHLAMTLHLGEGEDKYTIVEVTQEEFERETDDEEDESTNYNWDMEDDWDWEAEDDNECWD